MLRAFATKTTKKFKVQIMYNGQKPDITHDTVTILFKKNADPNAPTELSVDADVTTEGINGVASFHISATDNTLEPGIYFYEIWWNLANGTDKYLLTEQNSKVKILPTIA